MATGQFPGRPANVETTNTGTVYHVQEDGSKVIAGSRRPDGTFRKPVRVRAGYTPLEENRYNGPEAQQRFHARGIPGMGPADAPAQQSRSSRPTTSSSGFPPGYAPDTSVPKAKAKPKAKPKAESAPKAKAEPKAKAAAAPPEAEPVKPENRLRNLRKKLTEIASLEEKATKETLSEAQKEKVSRKEELEKEVDEIEKEIAKLQI
eukprot:TRINITY_DN12807_c2_g1_i1.p1 TRINITY_DN12807_c2_g1~~TRINITY_DN12807_c2_g1_i1.p1  ORF type:complete len:205 (-),score=59.56 TRINITY_DN12807_c2_g1_i1:144-758(-)